MAPERTNSGHADYRPPPDDHPDTRPFLCIPYWTQPVAPATTWDTGDVRPLPNAVVPYLCESIKASQYSPGEELRVTVAVRNSGGGNSAAIATVVVYWADPTTGFSTLNFFGATTVAVLPTRLTPDTTVTSELAATIPATAPQHICLLAVVSHPQDRAGTAFDPAGDRHWAQHNLIAAAVAPGAPTLIPFKVANPFNTDAEIVLRVGPADRQRAEQVAHHLDRTAAETSALLRLLDSAGKEIGEPGDTVVEVIPMPARGETDRQILVEVTSDLHAGTAVVIEALIDAYGARQRGVNAGGLGMVLIPPD
ncbi:MAG: hypothetical protein AB7G47_19565 [Mycolicibacterium sp.]|uniref:hypothetical protein n=1 Tax=Mycolicibacterium sp. TaxID=2320850 RepID=UPI003D14A0F9